MCAQTRRCHVTLGLDLFSDINHILDGDAWREKRSKHVLEVLLPTRKKRSGTSWATKASERRRSRDFQRTLFTRARADIVSFALYQLLKHGKNYSSALLARSSFLEMDAASINATRVRPEHELRLQTSAGGAPFNRILGHDALAGERLKVAVTFRRAF